MSVSGRFAKGGPKVRCLGGVRLGFTCCCAIVRPSEYTSLASVEAISSLRIGQAWSEAADDVVEQRTLALHRIVDLGQTKSGGARERRPGRSAA